MARRRDTTLNTRTELVPIKPDAPHVVVIGAGFGGLAAATRLLVRGYRVTVVERLDQPRWPTASLPHRRLLDDPRAHKHGRC